MEYNPYTETFNKLKDLASQSNEKKEKIEQQLEWYNDTSVEELKQKLHDNFLISKSNRSQLTIIENEIEQLRASAKDIESHIKSILNPLNWFSRDQEKYRKKYRDIKNTIDDKEVIKQEYFKSIEGLNKTINDLKSETENYINYDPQKNKELLDELKSAISSHLSELESVAKDKDQVDLELKPIVAEINILESNKRSAEEKSSKAKQYDDDLSAASNSYQRAMIHRQCEGELGEGSPKKIINEEERKTRRLNTDIQKAQKRAIEIGRWAARTIEIVIIDGNNMCYEEDIFVGLQPLKMLTTELQQKNYNIIVVFDSTIRQLLKGDYKEIKKQFPNDIKIHIVATKQKADETILELASNKESNYIISNDRFGDYNDKEAVKNERVIRHEIVNGYVMIHELKIRVQYAA